MKIVKLSETEATEILHLLRTVHMTVGEARDAVPPEQRDGIALFSMPLMGALHQTINELEGSIYEATEEPGGEFPFDPFGLSAN